MPGQERQSRLPRRIPSQSTLPLLRTLVPFLLFLTITSSFAPYPGYLSVPEAFASTLADVVIGDLFFDPSHLNITTGTMVIWNYSQGQTIHTVSSDNTTSDGSKIFASQTLNPGNSFNYAFNLPGLYLYRCGVHPFQMIAQVNVTGPPVTTNPPSPAESVLVPIVIGGVIAVATVIVAVVYFHRRRKSEP